MSISNNIDNLQLHREVKQDNFAIQQFFWKQKCAQNVVSWSFPKVEVSGKHNEFLDKMSGMFVSFNSHFSLIFMKPQEK